jgi:hypothetical protein
MSMERCCVDQTSNLVENRAELNLRCSTYANGIGNLQKIHNPVATRSLMSELFDPQMANIADFDCFSQVVFESLEDYKRMKEDPWYKQHLVGDHENFADTKRSM